MVILFILGITAILASFLLNTLLRLQNASKTYRTFDQFENACDVSITYVKGGIRLSIGILLLCFLGMAITVYKSVRE